MYRPPALSVSKVPIRYLLYRGHWGHKRTYQMNAPCRVDSNVATSFPEHSRSPRCLGHKIHAERVPDANLVHHRQRRLDGDCAKNFTVLAGYIVGYRKR